MKIPPPPVPSIREIAAKRSTLPLPAESAYVAFTSKGNRKREEEVRIRSNGRRKQLVTKTFSVPFRFKRNRYRALARRFSPFAECICNYA
jgi:hypothetical protein